MCTLRTTIILPSGTLEARFGIITPLFMPHFDMVSKKPEGIKAAV